MKSKTSLFNRTIILNLLKRYWVVFAAYLLVLVGCVIMPLINNLQGQYWNAQNVPYYAALLKLLQESMEPVMIVNFIVGPIIATLLFSYLYNTRHTGMMASLPVKRETMFCSVCAAAILGMLACNLAVAAMALGVEALYNQVHLVALGILLLVSLGTILIFFGMAAFCCMLTGNIFAGPAVYIVFGFLSVAVESLVNVLLKQLVFGIPEGFELKTDVLSPAWAIFQNVDFHYESIRNAANQWVDYTWYISGTGLLTIYAAVGLVLLGLALQLYKHRRMEVAGDTIAIEVLKPVFSLCCTVGSGLLLAVFLQQLLYEFSPVGWYAAAYIAGLLIVGGTVGYFISRMLITRTITVFRSGWKSVGLYVLCAVAVVTLIETDAIGYERRVPDVAKIESVRISTDGFNIDYTDPENVQTIVKLHKNIIANKSFHEWKTDSDAAVAYVGQFDDPAATFSRHAFNLTYTLTNGDVVYRRYAINYGPDEILNEKSEIHLLENLLNTEEGILGRCTVDYPLTGENLTHMWIDYVGADNVNRYFAEMTNEQRLHLYYECILPDIKDGTLGKLDLIEDKEYAMSKYSCTISMEIYQDASSEIKSISPVEYYKTMHFYPTLESKRTMAYLNELGICPVTVYEVALMRGDDYTDLGRYNVNGDDDVVYYEITGDVDIYTLPADTEAVQ